MYEPWQIQLFGNLRVRQGERLITRFRSQQTGELLAYLAYHRHQSHGRESLIEIFWPKSEPATGRHNLSNALSSLRSQLEPPGVSSGSVIIADRFSVELNPDAVTTDVAEFEQSLRRAAQARTAPNYVQRLAEAAEQYRGSLLPHYYEDWIAPERERLRQRFVQTVSQLIGLLEKAGETERALEAARRALSADPLREESHRDVMRLLAASGQPEEALRQFRELERIFKQALGERPSSTAQQLAHQIEAQFAANPPSTLPPPVAARDALRTEVSAPSLPTGTVTFLLTDIEGSTALREKTGEAFRTALATHHTLLRSEFRRNGGQEIKEAGDSILVAFSGASDALSCAIACQRSLASQPWPEAIGGLNVRMALHTGDVELEEGEYHGLMLHRAARMLSAGYGGQILVSEETAGLLRRDLEPATHLKDLGVWRLRDVEEPERLFQVESSKLEMREFPPLNADPARTARLPLQFTRFFGRTEEIANIAERLRSPEMRLLTLTGPGGTGKTRLAIEAVSKVAETFQGGIWFVPLADIADAGLITGEIVDALGIPRSGQVEPIEQAVSALAKQPSLLILDNFEQIVEDGAAIVQTLLQRLPSLQCVVTSRQLLGLPGEQAFAVPPLATPNGADTPERLSLFESVRLFVDRAQASKPDFRVTTSNAPDVAELCDRLEGLPLAIELAAARTLVLTPSQMLQHLSRRFEFLVSRGRGVAERQRTQWAAIDWSYRLLSPDLQRFFAQLSVFRGGWTVEAAEAVCEEPLALDNLAQLRECSLIMTEESTGTIRFRMLEMLREFGQEKLATEDPAGTERRHADFFLTHVETIWPAEIRLRHGSLYVANGNQPESFRRGMAAFRRWGEHLEPDQDNLRVGLKRALVNAETEWVLRMSLACHPFWRQHGRFAEAVQWLRAGLESPGESTAQRAEALFWAGFFTKNLGKFSAAQSFHQQALDIRRELDDPGGVATSLLELGNVYYNQGDYASALPYFEEALPISREIGEDGPVAEILLAYGATLGNLGDRNSGRQMVAESILLAQDAGMPRHQIWGSRVMAWWYKEEGTFTSALPLLHDALRIATELGDRREITATIGDLAILTADQGFAERATRLMGVTTAFQEAMELPWRSFDEYTGTLSEALGAAAFTVAWEAGRAMTWEPAIAYALDETGETVSS